MSIAGDVKTKEGLNFGYETAIDKTSGNMQYKNLDEKTQNGVEE